MSSNNYVIVLTALLLTTARGYSQTPPEPPPLPAPASQRYQVDLSGGAVRFYGEVGVFVLFRVTGIGQQPATPVFLVEPGSPWGYPQQGITFPRANGQAAFYDTLLNAEAKTYTATVQFTDGSTLQHDFALTDIAPTLVAPAVRATSPPDGSLSAEWDPVDGAKGYWAVLFEQQTDPDTGDVNFVRLASQGFPSSAPSKWTLPARSLEPGKTYVAAIYSLSIDPGASPLPATFTGNTGSQTFASGATQPAYRVGDLNQDDNVDVKDATLSLRIAVGLDTPTDIEKRLGDANGDGKLNIADTTLILRAAVGVISLPLTMSLSEL